MVPPRTYRNIELGVIDLPAAFAFPACSGLWLQSCPCKIEELYIWKWRYKVKCLFFKV